MGDDGRDEPRGDHRNGRIRALDPPPRGVLFDYGNTLIPFGRREMDRIGDALVRFVREKLPDRAPLEIRDALTETWVDLHRERITTLRESDTRDVIRGTFARLGAPAPGPAFEEEGLRVIVRAFTSASRLGEGSLTVLSRLRERGFRLGLLSNYSLGEAIRASLAKLDLHRWFDAVVVSGDLGWVKPHPEVFREAARRLGLPPAEILYVGDNPRADIAGAKAAGMRAAHVTQHLDGAYHFEHPDENAAEVAPDLVCERLADLIAED